MIHRRIKHPQYLAQRRVFDNGEWAVACADPQRDEIAQAALRVGRAMREVIDHLLSGQCPRGRTLFNVPIKVAGRVVRACTSDNPASPAKGTSEFERIGRRNTYTLQEN